MNILALIKKMKFNCNYLLTGKHLHPIEEPPKTTCSKKYLAILSNAGHMIYSLQNRQLMWRSWQKKTLPLRLITSSPEYLSMKEKPTLLEDQFIDMKFITSLTGLSDKWFYKLIQDGLFPRPIKLGRASRWLKSDLNAWLQDRIDESRD